MRRLEKRTYNLTLHWDRWAWLEAIAEERRQTLQETLEAILHNASLDYQMTRAPESDPDLGPPWME